MLAISLSVFILDEREGVELGGTVHKFQRSASKLSGLRQAPVQLERVKDIIDLGLRPIDDPFFRQATEYVRSTTGLFRPQSSFNTVVLASPLPKKGSAFNAGWCRYG